MQKDTSKGNQESQQPVRFEGTVLLNGKTATGIPVPSEVLEAMGAGKKPPVRVSIGTYTYRTTIGSVDGNPMIPVSAEVRAGAGIAAGDVVTVELALDNQPREVSLPPDFADALNKDTQAKQCFEGLSYSNKRRFTLPVEEAKSPETRQRRIEKAINTLHEGKI